MTFNGLGPIGAGVALAVAAIVSLLAVWLRPLFRRRVVAFGEMWREVLAERRKKLPWAELLALALFAAALTALAVGVAGPVLGEQRPQRVAVLLDVSASMAATDSAGVRRIDRARVAAHNLLEATREDDEVAVFAMGSRTVSLEPWQLATVEPEHAAADIDEAVALAAAFLSGGAREAQRHLVVISDAPVEIPEGDWTVSQVLFGEPAENLAVSALGLSPGAEGMGGIDVLVTVANFGQSVASADLVVHTPKFRLAQGRVELPPGKFTTRTFHVEQLPSREVWASLSGTAFASGEPDALDSDDRRVAWSPADGFLDVALVTEGNRFLQGAITVLGGVRLQVRAPGERISGVDVVILDRTNTPVGPDVRGVLRIGTATGDALEAPELVDWNGDHPATRRVNLDALTIAEARVLPVGDDDVVLAAAREGAIAVARDRGSRREVELGFDVTQSDFPLRFGFPIFVGSALRWLANARDDVAEVGIAGRPIPLDSVGDVQVEEVVPAPGQRIGAESPLVAASSRITRRGTVRELHARRAGLYHLSSGPPVVVGVDPAESRLAQGTTDDELPAFLFRNPAPSRTPWTAIVFALAAVLLGARAWIR